MFFFKSTLYFINIGFILQNKYIVYHEISILGEPIFIIRLSSLYQKNLLLLSLKKNAFSWITYFFLIESLKFLNSDYIIDLLYLYVYVLVFLFQSHA